MRGKFLTIAFLLFPGLAFAQDKVIFDPPPSWTQYAKHVQSFTNVVLRENGTWQITTKFSNGNKLAVQHMVTELLVFTKDGRCLFGAAHEVDLAPSLGGSANEYTADTFGKISPRDAVQADNIRYRAHQLTTQIQEKFNATKSTGTTIPVGISSGCSSNQSSAVNYYLFAN